MLSFVIPTFKPKSDIFEKHLKSMKAQALKEWEAIYVLDGDNQEAKRDIKRIFKNDERVKIIEIAHSGAQVARNTGGKAAKGEFLCFMDSDCLLEPGTSLMWVEKFDKHPEIAFIYSGYKYFGDRYAIDSEPFDPWTLKIRNYISACFPLRKTVYPGWTEGLKSLQDWDFWLSVVEKCHEQGLDASRAGLFIPGHAFITPLPEPGSISGEGCKPDNWLDRMDAVKKLHHIPDKDICVSSLQYRHEGLALAKLLDVDYQTIPNDKPHKYKTIIQVGYSLGSDTERHAAIFQEKEVKKIIFWTGDNINELYHAVSFQSIDANSKLLNDIATQYVEDLEAKRLMERAGFKVEIMPLPLGEAKIQELPKEKKWVVDIAGNYSQMLSVIEKSLPDIPLEMAGPNTNLYDYTGLIHFFPDRTTSSSVKRALMTGRHVVSNIQQPFCGFVDDKWEIEKFIVETVDRVRDLSNKPADPEAANYYSGTAENLKKAVLA